MTKIEWVKGEDGTDGLSWNALRAERNAVLGGRCVRVSANHCEHVNEACRFCYAGDFNPRHGGLPFKRQNRDQYDFVVDEEKLLYPVLRRKPTRVFVESMSDAFGEWWPQEFVDKLYAVKALTPRHTYINLTKRPDRRREYLADDGAPERIAEQASEFWLRVARTRGKTPSLGNIKFDFGKFKDGFGAPARLRAWPLPNVIEGTSVSCQEEADAFVPELLATNCALRCVSAEPLLGPIDWTRFLYVGGEGGREYAGALRGMLHWIIVGGESGSRARPMHPQWARDIRDQCTAAGVPFFFKQWGGFIECERRGGRYTIADRDERVVPIKGAGRLYRPDGWEPADPNDQTALMHYVGKKKAGRLLDGRTHDGFPIVRATP